MPDEQCEERLASSPSILAERLCQFGAAWKRHDDRAAREELRALSHEALLLARSPLSLWQDGVARRQDIAVGKSHTPRSGTS